MQTIQIAIPTFVTQHKLTSKYQVSWTTDNQKQNANNAQYCTIHWFYLTACETRTICKFDFLTLIQFVHKHVRNTTASKAQAQLRLPASTLNRLIESYSTRYICLWKKKASFTTSLSFLKKKTPKSLMKSCTISFTKTYIFL